MLEIFLSTAYLATKGYFTDIAKQVKSAPPTQIDTTKNNPANTTPNNQNGEVKSTDLLSELNADLAKQKAANDPFGDKKVKIDLESLGLDDVNKTNTAGSAPANLPTNQNIAQPLNPTPDNKEQLKVADLPKVTNQEPVNATNDKPQNPEVKTSDQKPNTDNNQAINQAPPQLPAINNQQVNDIPKTDNKIANSDSNKNQLPTMPIVTQSPPTPTPKTDNAAPTKEQPTAAPKENLISKVAKLISKTDVSKQETKEPEIVAKTKEEKVKPPVIIAQNSTKKSKVRLKTIIIDQKKLQQLKKQYLDDFTKDRDEQKIIPRRKEIVNYVTTPTPPPLLARSYDQNNSHNPVLLNRQDKINLLFNSFTNRDLSYFISAYKTLNEPDLKNKFGDTILTYATILERHDIMATILSEGANPDLTNDLGYSALSIAIELQDYKAVQLLIEAKANINYADQNSKTYLMQAVMTGFLPIIDLLITNHIDINATNNQGQTALDIALSANKDIVAKFLINKGAKKSLK